MQHQIFFILQDSWASSGWTAGVCAFSYTATDLSQTVPAAYLRVWIGPTRSDSTHLECTHHYNRLDTISYISFFFFFFFFWHYNPRWTLASSKIIPHSSRSCDSRLQFFTPKFLRASSIDSRHLHLGFPTCQVPCGLCRVSFLQGSSSGRVLSFYLGNI